MGIAKLTTLLWLALFWLDAVVGLLLAALSALGVANAMGPPVVATGLLLTLGTVLYVPLWVGLPRAPWWILGLLAFLGWEAGGLLPLPAVFLDLEATARWGALLQALVAISAALAWHRGALLADRPERSGWVTVGRSLALPALFLVGVAAQVSLMGWSLKIATGGFAQVDLTGLETGQRTCTRGDRTIHLVGAVHIGERSGYDALLAEIPDDALLLAEGVTDDTGRLTRFSYDRLADAIGLVPQRPAQAEPGTEAAEGEGRFRTRRADVDVASFDERTIVLLQSVGQALESPDPVAAWARSSSQLDLTEGTLEAVRHDILDSRNDALLAVVDEELEREARLLVPWGALHLRGIHDGLEERGFSCDRPRYVRMFRWATILETIRNR